MAHAFCSCLSDSIAPPYICRFAGNLARLARFFSDVKEAPPRDPRRRSVKVSACPEEASSCQRGRTMVPARRPDSIGMAAPGDPDSIGIPLRPNGSSVPQAGRIQAAFVRYQPGLTCTGRPRMARASLRSGAIRKEMLPYCVQQPGAWPPQRAVPIESGRFALAHQTPSAAHRAANPDSTCPDSIGIGIPPVNRGDIPMESGARFPCLHVLMLSLTTPGPSQSLRSGFPLLSVFICGFFLSAFSAPRR